MRGIILRYNDLLRSTVVNGISVITILFFACLQYEVNNDAKAGSSPSAHHRVVLMRRRNVSAIPLNVVGCRRLRFALFDVSSLLF